MVTAYISHPDCLLHDTGPGHPENAGRLKAIEERVRRDEVWGKLVKCEAPKANWQQIAKVHDLNYIETIQRLFPLKRPQYLDSDTLVSKFSLEAALRAAGACVHGVDLVMSGSVENAFCAVRPPGHHACVDQSMGFCVFNNIAVAAMHALEAYRLQRVLIVDFDVHHGNGTEDIFANHPNILMCGTFQSPFYPNSGGLNGAHNMVNGPVGAGSSLAEIKDHIQSHWIDAIDEFKPQLVLVSAGFDAHQEDPLAQLNLSTEDYAWLTGFLIRVADTYCDGRVVSSLEGGYNHSALGDSVCAHLRGLSGLA
ncbi:MAG: histone deacetylase family protein [Limnobacter sp.]|nr:histone deacetylase family protein [Limnobacter sp.]